MFGVGPQELLIIAVLFLAVFSPTKFAGMARDVGRFTNDARRAEEDVKGELISEEVDEARHAVGETEDAAVPAENETSIAAAIRRRMIWSSFDSRRHGG